MIELIIATVISLFIGMILGMYTKKPYETNKQILECQDKIENLEEQHDKDQLIINSQNEIIMKIKESKETN